MVPAGSSFTTNDDEPNDCRWRALCRGRGRGRRRGARAGRDAFARFGKGRDWGRRS